MTVSKTCTPLAALAALALGAAAPVALADDDAEIARQDRILELERKVEVLTEELGRLRDERAVSEEPPPLESFAGLGPAASKIYGLSRGLSLGGYAEAFYRHFVGDEDGDPGDNANTSDALRVVLYAGYKFTDKLLFNTEIEFEHGTTGENLDGRTGSVSVEFANLDYLWRDEVNFRGGLLLTPMGFVNEMHEPPFFHGVARPVTEQLIIPTTWRDNGAGVFGRIGESFEYRAYAMTALDAAGLSSSGLRGTRSDGSRSRSEDFAGVFRLDWTPIQGLMLGGSVYSGDIDQERAGLPDSNLTLYELHAQYRYRGLELRGLFAQAFLEDADDMTLALRASGDIGAGETIAEEMLGGYLEVAYDVMPWLRPDSEWYLAPFLRFEYVDTQSDVPSGALFDRDESKALRIWNPGLSFKPHPNVVLKLDYRNFDPLRGDRADEVQVGFGVAF